MSERFSIDVELPEFMNLMEAEARKRILEEVKERIGDQVAGMVESNAREIIAQKLDIFPSELVSKESEDVLGEAEEPTKTVESATAIDLKTTLAEEILSLSEGEALRRLKLSLAKGEIDEATFQELKSLVEPVAASKKVTCPTCGRELEPSVNFCRFCGSKVR